MKNNTITIVWVLGLIITLILGAYGWTTYSGKVLADNIIVNDKESRTRDIDLKDCIEENQKEILKILSVIQTNVAVVQKDIEYIKKKK